MRSTLSVEYFVMFVPNTLIENADTIRELRPHEQAVDFDRDAWDRACPDVDFDDILGHGALAISRDQCLNHAPQLDPYNLIPCDAAFPALLQLFIAVMVWGFGRTGYGPHRVAAMLRAPNLKPTLCAVARAIAFGMYGAAYDTFRTAKIPYLGASFASKYLHFCSARSAYVIKALIFDSRVASGLRKSNLPPDFWYYLTRTRSIANSSVHWTASGYLQYLILMHCWASSLSCTAEQIEYFLFTHGGRA